MKNDPKTKALAKMAGEASLRDVIRIPTDKLAEFVQNGGLDNLVRILGKLANGNDILAAEKMYLDYFKDYLPFARAKLSSIEQKLDPETVELFKVYLPKREEKK